MVQSRVWSTAHAISTSPSACSGRSRPSFVHRRARINSNFRYLHPRRGFSMGSDGDEGGERAFPVAASSC